MNIQKEKDLYLAELLEREVIKKYDFDDIVFKPEINAFHSSYLSARFIDNINFGWSAWQAAKAQAVPESPWVEFGFPELHKDESSDCLTSKEVFFELLNSGGTYHGWYIARPVDKRDQCCCEEEFEDGDVEYEYFFNANVGDELFDEDHISRWMYVPNVKEQSHDQD